MNAYSILSNNPKVKEKYPEAKFFDSPASEVLTAARDAVHKGAKLLTHPLSGSLVPSMNPYKSLIVTESSNQLDFSSSRLIEDAIIVNKKNGRLKYRAYNEKLLDDFQTLDLDFMVSALPSLKNMVESIQDDAEKGGIKT